MLKMFKNEMLLLKVYAVVGVFFMGVTFGSFFIKSPEIIALSVISGTLWPIELWRMIKP
jgi:hypothetical protein